MPPKNAQKGGGSAAKKADTKKKEKVIEDKTFGLKNKKGGKAQKYIQQVEKQVKSGGLVNLDKQREENQKKKDLKKKQLDELNDIFRPVQVMGSKGGDPKSILCAFFKQGSCGKGSRCKFSHDLTVERKAEKRSAYDDAREKEEETIDDWDLDTLNEAINKKHGNEKARPTTDIICKFFLDALESSRYGWFWECPNGNNCKYRHALPSGYVLKKDRKRLDNVEEISLEDLIERERAALGHDTTRVTLETFLAWKKKKIKEKEQQDKKEQDKKKKKYNKGEDSGLSGRDMFTFNPELDGLMEDGDDTFDIFKMKKEDREDGEEEEPEEHFKEIDMNALMSEMLNEETNHSDRLSVANADRFSHIKKEIAMEEEKKKKDQEAAASLENGATCEGAEGGDSEDGDVDIDEDLFGGDDEDLDDLEDELEDMNLN